MELAKKTMNKKEYKKIVGAKIIDPNTKQEKLIDLSKPLNQSVEMKFIFHDEREGKEIFWHSSAHILGHSLEDLYSCLLCTGPVKEHEGFYYDANFPKSGETISNQQLDHIQKAVNNLIREKNEFQRIDVTYEQACDMFSENKFKKELIDKHIQKNNYVSIYRVGNLVDLCSGPHLPHSGYIGEIVIQKQSGSYWQGNAEGPKTQRIHGISFKSRDEYKQWKKTQEEIAKRDHRVIAKQQKLFTLDMESPGAVGFLPNGTFIYNKLIEMLRREYRIRGYQEVITPNVFNIELWQTSGHLKNYREDMYIFDSEDKWYGLKPMN